MNILPDALDIFFKRAVLSFAEGEIPITFLVDGIILAEQPMTRLHFIDVRKEGCRPGDIAYTEKIAQCLQINLPLDDRVA